MEKKKISKNNDKSFKKKKTYTESDEFLNEINKNLEKASFNYERNKFFEESGKENKKNNSNHFYENDENYKAESRKSSRNEKLFKSNLKITYLNNENPEEDDEIEDYISKFNIKTVKIKQNIPKLDFSELDILSNTYIDNSKRNKKGRFDENSYNLERNIEMLKELNFEKKKIDKNIGNKSFFGFFSKFFDVFKCGESGGCGRE